MDGTPFWTALVNQRAGEAPGPTYFEFVRRRAMRIRSDLVHLKQMARKLNPAAPAPGRRRSHEDAFDDDDDDESDTSCQPPDRAVVVHRQHRERTKEKTHIIVTVNPFSHVDGLNRNVSRGRKRVASSGQHYYLAAVAGPFAHDWQAERYGDIWGQGSRGSAPRSAWGDALKCAHSLRYFLDGEVIFSPRGPIPVPYIELSSGNGSMVAVKAEAATDDESSGSCESESASTC